MIIRAVLRFFTLSLVCLLSMGGVCAAQSEPADQTKQSEAAPKLQFVVILSRHGVRSPIGDPHQLDKYATAPWPKWEVPPSYLTPHGYELMKLFGAWDRANFAGKGLFAPTGCGDADRINVIADSDERTIQTGKALVEGMFPNCPIEVHAKPEGTPDSLFRLIGGAHGGDREMAVAAVKGRIGGDPNRLTEAFRPQLTELNNVLAGCGHAAPGEKKRESIFDIPATFGSGSEITASYHGPINIGSTMAEDFLLEYTDGKGDAETGWGCVNGAKLRELMQIGTANWDFNVRTSTVARIYASNLLDRIGKSLEQSVSGNPVAGALSRPGDRVLLLVGHDTNLATVAGALGINWVIDGRVDDTPPGGALLFEVWRPAGGGPPYVRVEYTAQTLEQMHSSQVLTTANPPANAPVFVPGCSRQDGSCTWEGFSAAAHSAIDPEYLIAGPQ